MLFKQKPGGKSEVEEKNMLPKIVIEPKDKATASVIWLHGLGADGHDFESIVPELDLSQQVRFIFPHAPIRPITIYQGYEMRAWYDVFQMDFSKTFTDEEGIRESSSAIDQLIDHEIQTGISSNRIILAGFSQGGAIVLHAGLRYPTKLGGLLVLSSYLPLANTLQKEASKANQTTPILMLHGIVDNIIPIQIAQKSYELLFEANYPVKWNDYPMQHCICTQEIEDIKKWLKNLVAK